MLEIVSAPDHVAAYRVAGTLSGDDYDRIVADVEAKLARHRKLGVYLDLTGFEDVTFEAGLKDARYSLSKIFQLGRFPREAVVTDKQWIRTLAKVASPLVPGVEVRAFAPSERDQALDWAGQA
jgi:hypothetical protein